MSKQKFQGTKARQIVALTARLIKENPHFLDDIDDPNHDTRLEKLRYALKQRMPELADRKKCACCDASLAIRETKLDINIVVLLHKIAMQVGERFNENGGYFTQANRVHVSNNARISHTCQCQTTKAAKLGLIAKAGDGDWAVTRRGWEALKDKPTPAARYVFRNQIVERPDELTTFSKVIAEHTRKVGITIGRGKKPRIDMRGEVKSYDPNDYARIVGYAEQLGRFDVED